MTARLSTLAATTSMQRLAAVATARQFGNVLEFPPSARSEPAPALKPIRSTSLDMLLMRAKAYVEENLSRPDICVAGIARRMGCSPRYVFRAFQTEGATPAEFIWRRRLEGARTELVDPAARHLSISEIAFSFGFSSSAHFSRAFRRRYGMAPRECRPTGEIDGEIGG